MYHELLDGSFRHHGAGSIFTIGARTSGDLTFRVDSWRFSFVAREPVHFPAGKSGNTLRGAFGSAFRDVDPAAFAQVFEPRGGPHSPSGLADLPRPFVFRAAHLDGHTVQTGERFHFDVNLFGTRHGAISHFVTVFEKVVLQGVGPGRGRADLESVSQRSHLELPPVWDGPPVSRLRVRFVTPTELKSRGGVAETPEFGVLFARARDRVSTISALYGAGALDLDFRAAGERATGIEMTKCDIRWVNLERRSSRTGQVHPIGGFFGEAEYSGEVTEFMPVLRAAEWTGVGRHTVWGNGVIELAL